MQLRTVIFCVLAGGWALGWMLLALFVVFARGIIGHRGEPLSWGTTLIFVLIAVVLSLPGLVLLIWKVRREQTGEQRGFQVMTDPNEQKR